MKLDNITFVDYVNLKDRSEYDYALRYGIYESKDLFLIGEMVDCPFGFVKDMQDILNYEGLTWEKLIDEISTYKKINKADVANRPLFDLHKFRLYLKEQVEKINEIEQISGHAPEPDEESAGIEVFAKYRAFLQYDKLSNGDITKIEEIKKLPYSICFAKLMLDADKADYEEKLFKIRRPK